MATGWAGRAVVGGGWAAGSMAYSGVFGGQEKKKKRRRKMEREGRKEMH